MSQYILLYPILPAAIAGFLHWIYRKRKGFTSTTQLGMSFFVFYAVFYGILRLYYSWNS